MHPESEEIFVPWTGFDVLLFLAVWLVAQIVFGGVLYIASPPQPSKQSVVAEKNDHRHFILQLVEQGKNSSAVLLIAFLSVVVATPLLEEFLYRLLFQGWLEATLLRYQIPSASGVAIVAVSACFAFLHAGSSGSLTTQGLLFFIGAVAFTNLLIFLLGILYLKRKRNVIISRCLFGSGRFFPPQFLTYVGYCLLALVLIFGISATLKILYPGTNTNPIPIFFFSLLLGTLYSKTQNLSYCILLHAFLNGTSLTIAYLTA